MSAPSDNAIVYHPAPGGNIAKYHLAKSAAKESQLAHMFVVLDVSGSMGSSVGRIVKHELPSALTALGYSLDDTISIIAFESNVHYYSIKIRDLARTPLCAMGGTTMAPAIDMLESKLLAIATDQPQPVRILTLTDGHVNDQAQALQRANAMRARLDGRFIFNSQAVRTFTSSAQPDTTALTGMMQLSNSPSSITDVWMVEAGSYYGSDLTPIGTLSKAIVPLFIDDGLQSGSAMLRSSEPVIMTSPWKQATNVYRLVPGENVFWIKPGNEATFTINDVPVALRKDESALNDDIIQRLLRGKIDQSLVQISVLKVNNTAQAQAEIRQILDYWTQLDQSLNRDGFDMNKILATDTSLATRFVTFREYRKRAERSFAARMSEIANDDRVNQLNSAQSADYLRNVSSGSNAKAMARRMVGNGVDTVSVMRRELLAIRANIKELIGIDDANHFRSFYSLATTLECLRLIAEMPEDEILNLNQDECLRLIGIVGIAADGPLGEFPDPMCYQLNALYAGTHVSLSDVLTAKSIGGDLEVPGQPGKTIINVIPVFNDDRIHRFLLKYAPKTIQIIASVGMRRVAGEIGMTYGYTLAAGIVQLIHILARPDGRTEGNIRAFYSVVRDFRTAVGCYFNHILPQLVDPVKDISYWLGRNGLTNMIIPIMELQAAGRQAVIPDVLRALYTFEIWQPTRRLYRRADDPSAKADELLNKLMPWDIEKIKVPVTPLFEPNPVPAFCSDYELNMDVLEEHHKRCWFVDYLCKFPEMLHATTLSEAECILKIRGMTAMTDDALAADLGITYPMKKFRFYNLVQAFTVRTSEDRFDVDAKKTKPVLVDLRDQDLAEKMCRDVVTKYVDQRYSRDLAAKVKAEIEMITTDYVTAIIESSPDRALKLIQDGVTRGTCTVKMATQSSLAYQKLRPALLEPALQIPSRNEIIQMLLLAKWGDVIVWNSGNTLPQTTDQLSELKAAWMFTGTSDSWDKIVAEYMANRKHVYRNALNRHGHNNDNPSYYGYGFATLEAMVDSISLDAWSRYCENHTECCGMKCLSGIMTARIKQRLA